MNDDLIAAIQRQADRMTITDPQDVKDHEALRALIADLRAGNLVRREDAVSTALLLELAELREAKKEIALLRDIVVTYGDKVRMATAHRMDWQQAIDRAFDRD